MEKFGDDVLAGAALAGQQNRGNFTGRYAPREMRQPLHLVRFGHHLETAISAVINRGKCSYGLFLSRTPENNNCSGYLPVVIPNRRDGSADWPFLALQSDRDAPARQLC